MTGRFRYREIDIPLDGLSAAAVGRLWGRYRRCRRSAARNRLWEHYYGLAFRLAVKARGGMGCDRGLTVGDLAQWAGVGVLGAIERFDPDRKVKFEVYAWGRMRGAVADGLRDWDVLSRAGRRAARRAEKGSERHDDLMASRLSGVRRFSEVAKFGYEPLLRGEGGYCVLDGSDEWDWLMRGLSRRDRLILALYFREGLTMKEIGVVVGRTESLVSQAVRSSKGLIRERVESRF